MHPRTAPGGHPSGSFRAVLGSLLFVELFSGVIQFYFTPLYPLLAEIYDVDVGTLSWALIVFTLSGALSTPLFARLGDVYGHRRVLRIEVGIVALGSVLIAVAPSFPLLLAGRFLQGTFPAFLPLMFGLVRNRFDLPRTQRAVSYLSAILLFGTLVGAISTSLLIRAADGPQWALWLPAIGTVIGFGLLWLGHEPPPARKPGTRVDWQGAVVLGVAMAGLLLGIERGHDWGWSSAATIGCLLGGAALLAGWVVLELRATQPLADLRFLFRPQLAPVYLVGIGVYFGAIGGQVAMSTYLGLPGWKLGYGLGLDPATISLLFIPILGLAALMALLTEKLGRRVGLSRVMIAGSLLATVAQTGFVFFHSSVPVFIGLAMAMALGLGLIEASTRTVVASSVRESEASMGQSVYEMSTVIGVALGGAVLGAVLGAHQAPGENAPSETGYVLGWTIAAGFALMALIAAVVHAVRTGSNRIAGRDDEVDETTNPEPADTNR